MASPEQANSNAVKDQQTYFFEDEVFTVTRRGRIKLAVVVSPGANVSDEEDEDYVDPGKVRICTHPKGREITLPLSQVGLVDRTLAPGDVVRRVDGGLPGQPKQFGYCQELNVTADMNVVGTNYVILNVPAKRCAPLHRMTPGAVLLDSWIGVSDKIMERLVLQMSCGSLIETVMCAEQSPLWDIEDTAQSYFTTSTYHVGQILVGALSHIPDPKWLYTSPEMRGSRRDMFVHRKFLVQSVELDEVTIYWQIKPNVEVNSLDEISFSEPPKVVRGEDLKRIQPMNVFEDAMLQINDKHQVTVVDTDRVVTRHEWRRELGQKFRLPHKTPQTAGAQRSPRRNPTNVKVVVSGSGEKEEERRDNVFAVPQPPPPLATGGRQNLKPPPVTRGQSLGKLEGEQTHHSQFLTVAADSRRSQSLDTAATEDSDATLDGADNDETSASGSDFSSNTHSSCSTNTTPRGSPKCSPLLAHKLRRLHKQKKGRRDRKREEPPVKVPEPGQTVFARAVCVYSTVTVLWQDGTLERDIPSRQLFPMHTLDHHEFFPSDFVLHATSDKDTEDWHNYGVIQTMDHVGRMARVKWFETAKSYDQDPKYKGQSEVSVYDLKDHLQFQYRPGTIVVRLRKRSANAEEEADGDEGDGGGQLGQVIDNSPEGTVKVVWVNKKVSSCWPQDIFELGNYDSGMFISHDHLNFVGDLEDDEDADGSGGVSEDSWLTESEECVPGDQQTVAGGGGVRMKPATRAYLNELLERLKGTLVRMKALFKMNPQIFSGNVVNELMVIFKKCRYFDRLLDTQFFSEENFEGLVERVRKTAAMSKSATSAALEKEGEREEGEGGFLNASHSTPIKGGGAGGGGGSVAVAAREEVEECERISLEVPQILNFEGGGDAKRQSIKKGDSGHYSEMDEDHSSGSSSMESHKNNNNNNNNKSDEKATAIENSSPSAQKTKPTDGAEEGGAVKEQAGEECGEAAEASVPATIPVDALCAKFCCLLLEQMGKAFHEINTVYCNPSSEWEVVKEESMTEVRQTDDSTATTDADDATNAGEGGGGEQQQQQEGWPVAPPESFLVVDVAPTSHVFNLSLLQPKVPKVFFRAVKREHDMLRAGLPEGVWVRAYEERLDLFSVMIEGPANTPYEDGVFLFDIQLGSDYPHEPPNCHYISYCHDRLNPNLYEEGRVCVSLLGTWTGKGSEKWGPDSSLLQLIVSIQGLILVAEPYFNEAGYEKQVGTPQGCENSQIYNEMVVIKLVQSMMKLLESPPEIFKDRILNHFRNKGPGMIERIRGWVELSKEVAGSGGHVGDMHEKRKSGAVPDFPLVPASKGFCMTVEGLLGRFKQVIEGL